LLKLEKFYPEKLLGKHQHGEEFLN